jgi:hypothetical protein
MMSHFAVIRQRFKQTRRSVYITCTTYFDGRLLVDTLGVLTSYHKAALTVGRRPLLRVGDR